MKGIKIHKPTQGQRWVVADVHANLKTLQYLVEKKLRLRLEDQLFLLGDYLNRGPDSKGVIDYLIELQDDDFQLYPLRGNHEQMLLDSHEKAKNYSEEELRLPSIQRGRGLKDAKRQLYPKYLNFLGSLPYYYELDEFYLVHAGFNFTVKNPLSDLDAMLWTRDFTERFIPEKINYKRVIYGHTTTPLSAIKEAVTNKAQAIPLDNGCYKHSLDEYGHLCAFNLDTWELVCQKNLDKGSDAQ
ncbi:metallophosphoesterase [Microscilla marina]|uniref:Metallophosphoesterase n=1 Tax=Microscilla marina ATCC 23134 TaxID=313606 RepID=A1ZS22_MICM2|nr:metallophosphoesterase [Microscilla marina]EAY26745.1 metallophosphoesterase [Microscilla marina ATCC 23134]